MMPCAGVLRGFLVGFVLRIHWRPQPAASATHQQSRSCCQSGTDGIDP